MDENPMSVAARLFIDERVDEKIDDLIRFCLEAQFAQYTAPTILPAVLAMALDLYAYRHGKTYMTPDEFDMLFREAKR